MTTGKAGGLLGEPLKGVSKPLAASRRVIRKGANALSRIHPLRSQTNQESHSDQNQFQPLHRSNLLESPGRAGGLPHLITARDFHAAAAVMLVHAFETPEAQRADFESFRAAMKAERVGNLLYKVPGFDQPALYLAWCDGNSEYRKHELPNAI